MFCPRCGERLASRSGKLSCFRGRMELPEALSRTLEGRFRLEPRAGASLPEGPWFCPLCATALEASEGSLRCPRGCGCLDDLALELASVPHWIQC